MSIPQPRLAIRPLKVEAANRRELSRESDSPIIVDEAGLQGVAIEGRGDEGAGYG